MHTTCWRGCKWSRVLQRMMTLISIIDSANLEQYEKDLF